ncbi:MAG: tRNA pseudouridine(55) synthase TruB [Deltaproteobacteria bacterium]|nr:tRNA pseudouridine(55) synthase TruB [Deltaproteobacteria bacterium]
MSFSGLIIIDKDPGPGSHDVVRRMRRLLNDKSVGHAGTLDPFASGVLVVLVGHATLLSQFLILDEKSYEARLHWGAATDTQDGEGRVVESTAANVPSELEIAAAMERFTGAIEQIPPMFSAKKIDGRPLHKLARKGAEIDRKPVPVVVHELRLTARHEDGWSFFVRCSKGTYVRTLAHDMAIALGGLGHLTSLRRLASGPFTVDRAIKLADFEERIVRADDIARVAAEVGIGFDDALPHLPAIDLGPNDAWDLINGRLLPLDRTPPTGDVGGCDLWRCVDERGHLIAVATPRFDKGVWKTKRVFVDSVEYRRETGGPGASPQE